MFDNTLLVLYAISGGIDMPRVARIKSKSKIYHIMIRGINQQNIFSVDEDDEKFMAILSKYHKKSEYEIYAYNESMGSNLYS